jgi:uncharacterized SAM-binding protein YcdF (DUF218 family)
MKLFRRPRATLILGLGLLVCFLLALGLHRAGSYLVVSDRLEPSDAIFVLANGGPARLVEAGHLYRRGLAPLVAVSLAGDPMPVARQLAGQPSRQEEAVNVLLHVGVPPHALARLNRVVVNTYEELSANFDYARAHGMRRVILVTSPPHTRRVRIIWNALYQTTLPALVHPTPFDQFDAARWWRSSRSLEKGLHELGAIAHFVLGRPLPTYDR